jgi:RND family efflux transporter MFP subunit
MNKDHSFFRAKRALFIFGAVLIVIALVSMLILLEQKRLSVSGEMRERIAQVKAGPEVRVVAAIRSPGGRSVSLVGEARPYATVTLYAKVSGYIKEIRVDKGDRVKEGQVLAVIESPELDQQYEATLADAKNKRRDAIRAKPLLENGSISIQDADRAETAAQQAEANTEALRIQKDYQIIRAPFPAVVTARFVDPGALVQSAVTSQTAALPIVTLSKTNRIRVYVYLDQRDASLVRVGDAAEISDAARPHIRLVASVSRISGQLDDRTRTLLVEIDVDNSRGLLLAGGFVQVSLALKTQPSVEIPAAALLMKGEKSFVAVVSSGNRVSFRPVVISDSDAKTVRFSSGLEEGENVILNPGWGILDGGEVQPVAFTPR